MGSTIGVVLIVAMLIIMWATKKGEGDEKTTEYLFNSRLLNSLFADFLFDWLCL